MKISITSKGALALSLLTLLLAAPSAAQQAPQVDGPGGLIERYRLPNGVTVLLQPVPSLPTVAVALAVPVGSNQDPQSRPGTCRLLAQLQSRSPGSHPQGSLLLDLQEIGARSGFQVLSRWTVFHEAVPSQHVNWMLGVALERLKPARWSSEEIERQSILSGEDWRSEGASLAGSERHVLLSRLQGSALEKEPAAIPPTELQQFALQYWNPPAVRGAQGAVEPVLVVVGGFSTKAVREHLARLSGGSGSIPSIAELGAAPPPGPVAELAGGQEIQWLYPLPSQPEEMAVLALLDSTLTGSGISTSMNFLDNTYSVRGAASPSTAVSVEEDLHGRLKRAALALLDPDQLKQAQSIALRRYYRHFEDIEQRAAQLALDQGLSGLDRLSKFPEMLRQVTPATIANLAVRLLDDKISAKLRPAAGTFAATPASPRPIQAEPARVTAPKIGAAPDPRAKPEPPAPFTRLELDRGITILVQTIADMPTITVRGFFTGGENLDSQALAGRSQLLARAFEERVNGRPGWSESGLDLHFSSQPQFLGVEGWAPRDALNEWLTALAATLSPQPLAEGTLELSRSRLQSQLEQESAQPELQAYQQWLGLLYNEDNPLGRTSRRTQDSAKSLTLAQLNELLGALTHPNRLTLAFSGDVTATEVAQWLNPLIANLAPPDPAVNLPALGAPRPVAEKPPLMRIKGAASQTLVLTGTLAPARKDADYYAFSLLNQILGGEAITSRLAVRLRDKDASVTLSQSRFLSGSGPMPFLISLRVRPGRTDEVLAAVQEEIEKLRSQPVSETELARAVHSLEGQQQVSQSGPQGRANLLRNLELFHLSDGYSNAFAGLYRNVTAKEIQEVAKRRLAPANFCTVVLEP